MTVIFRSRVQLSAAAVLAGLMCTNPAWGETPTLEWGRQLGSTSSERNFGVAVDGTGNAYISGSTAGSLGGPDIPFRDAYLAKYDASGNLSWTRQLGIGGFTDSHSVATDDAGNAYISGWTAGGSLGGPNTGNQEAYLAKYDPSGNLSWAKEWGSDLSEISDISYSVAVDGTGNVYISGAVNLQIFGYTDADAFLTKFDTSGDFVWSRELATPTFDVSFSAATDNAGNVYISGQTEGLLGDSHAGLNDAFLAKYDGSGNLLWTEQLGTGSIDISESVAVDGAGNAYIAGYTQGLLGDSTVDSSPDAFLAKYDTSGNLIWTEQLGTAESEIAYSVAVDAEGNVYISGKTEGSLDGVNAGGSDTFFAKYDAAGNLIWTEQLGTATYDESRSITVDDFGNIYVGGETNGSLYGPNVGSSDVFLAKFSVPEPGSLALLALAGPLLLRRRR